MTTHIPQGADSSGEAWFPQMLRLVRWNILLLRRRLLGKILFSLLVGFFVPLVAIGLAVAFTVGASSQIGEGVRAGLTFPSSLHIAELYTTKLVAALAAILAGAFIGSEYGFGTQRQLLSRGTSRAQALTAQLISLGIIALSAAAVVLLSCTLIGDIIGPVVLGSAPSVLSTQSLGGLFLYWLALSYQLFIYMLLALFAATVGRAVIAGVAFSLGYFAVESIAVSILGTIAGKVGGAVGVILRYLPDWLPGTSVLTLIRYTEVLVFPDNTTAGLLSLPLALSIVGGYSVLFGGLSYWFYCTRDMID